MLWKIRDMQKQQEIPVRLAKIQTFHSPLSQTVGKQTSLLCCCWECKWCTVHGEQIGCICRSDRFIYPDSATPLLGRYSCPVRERLRRKQVSTYRHRIKSSMAWPHHRTPCRCEKEEGSFFRPELGPSLGSLSGETSTCLWGRGGHRRGNACPPAPHPRHTSKPGNRISSSSAD